MVQNYDSFFRSLRIIHLSLVAGVLFFLGVVYFVIGPVGGDDDLYATFRYLVPGMAVLAILGGRFLSGKMLEKIDSSNGLEEKLTVYRSASIVRWAMIEGVAFIAVVGFMLTGNTVMVLVALACVAYLFAQRPSGEGAATELSLDAEERRSIGLR